MMRIIRPKGYVTEVYPSLEEGEIIKRIIFYPRGFTDRQEEIPLLPLVFTVSGRFTIHTQRGLAALVYVYDPERGTLVVREILRPLPKGSYTLESVGGEKIGREMDLGVVYVNTSPTIVAEDLVLYSGAFKDLLHASLSLARLKVRVSDPAKLVISLWRKYLDLSEERLIQEVREELEKMARDWALSRSLIEALHAMNELEETITSTASTILNGYGVEVLRASVSLTPGEAERERLYWMQIHGNSPRFEYAINLLSRLPSNVIVNSPEVALLLAACALDPECKPSDIVGSIAQARALALTELLERVRIAEQARRGNNV